MSLRCLTRRLLVLVRLMADVSRTDIPASTVRTRKPVATREKVVMAARFSGSCKGEPQASQGWMNAETSVPPGGSQSQAMATDIASNSITAQTEVRDPNQGQHGHCVPKSQRDVVSLEMERKLTSWPQMSFAMCSGTQREEPNTSTANGSSGATQSLNPSFQALFTGPTSPRITPTCLPLYASQLLPPPLPPLGPASEVSQSPLTTRHCNAGPESNTTVGRAHQVDSLPLSATRVLSSSASDFDRNEFPVSMPAHAFRITLSIPELISTLPPTSKAPHVPLSPSKSSETSGSSAAATGPSVPAPIARRCSGFQFIETQKTYEPNRSSFPSSAFKVRAPPVCYGVPQITNVEEESMEIASTPLTCRHDIPKEPCKDSTTGGNKPPLKAASHTKLILEGKEVEDLSLSIQQGRQKRRKEKRERKRTRHRTPPVSPSRPGSVDDNNFLFAMDVEGLLLENETKHRRRKRKKLSTEPTGAPSSSGSSGEESETTTVKAKPKRLKGKELAKKQGGRKGCKPLKPTPNAFVSVRILSEQIRERVKEVQQGMLLSDKKLRSTLVPLKKLHLTLMVLRLEGEEDVQRAKTALMESVQGLASTLSLPSDPLVLEFCGVGSFGKGVVFAEIKDGASKQRLSTIAETVQSVFESHGLPSTDGRPFSPHLTLAKVSRSGRGGLKQIEKESYSSFRDVSFGSEVITCLELLSMTEPATDDGYYHSFGRCGFTASASASWM